MRTIISSISILSIFWIMSCNKKKSEPEPAPAQPTTTSSTTTGGNPNTGRNFIWRISNTSTAADSIVCFTDSANSFTRIQALDYIPNNQFFYVTFDISNPMLVGQYSLGSGSTNVFKYYDTNTENTATSGSLIISVCDSTKLSGNFNATLSTGAVITGTFTNIRRRIF
jgi:hypothetical protein